MEKKLTDLIEVKKIYLKLLGKIMSKEKLLNLGDDAGLTLVEEKISICAKKTQNFSRNTKLWLVNINMLTLWKTFLWLTDHVRA